MKIDVWGCRGSIPAPGPETGRYGGNTSCVQVSQGNTSIILDGGSGIQRLGRQLGEKHTKLHIFLTHLHIDHTMGLGFFLPLYDPKITVHIWGPAGSRESLQDRLRRYFSPLLFPLRLNELPTHPVIHEIHEGWTVLDDIKVLAKYICHPGPTMGFRLEAKGASFTYMPDHELRLGAPDFPKAPNWISGYDLALETDLLFHDAQYTDEEYAQRVGWGHSSMQDAIRFAEICKVRQLALFHHDPGRTDEQIDSLMIQLKRDKPFSGKLSFCAEENSYEL